MPAEPVQHAYPAITKLDSSQNPESHRTLLPDPPGPSPSNHIAVGGVGEAKPNCHCAFPSGQKTDRKHAAGHSGLVLPAAYPR